MTSPAAPSQPDLVAVLDLLPDPVIVVSPAIELLWGNQAAADAFGWSLDEVRGRDVAGLVHPDDVVTALTSLTSVNEKAVGTLIELRLQTRDGGYRTFEVRGRGAEADPRVGGTILQMRDVTERHRWDIAQGHGDLCRTILDHAPAITMLLDADGALRGASRALTTRLGRSLESTLGRRLTSLAHLDDASSVAHELRVCAAQPHPRTFEARLRTAGGDTVPMSLTAVNLLDDRTVEGIVVTAVDITDLDESRAQLRHLATHDDLTGLPNRAAFTAALSAALAHARVMGQEVGVVYCDVDEFKGINDRLGHLAGDALLVEIGRRLRTAVRDADLVARIGGDEFVMLVAGADERAVEELERRIATLMAEPIVLPCTTAVTASLTTGSATTAGSPSASEVLGRADAAMYAAKQARRGTPEPSTPG